MYKLSQFRNYSASLVLFWIVGKRSTTASFAIWANLCTLFHNLVQWRLTIYNSLTSSLMSSETESPVGNIMTILLRYLATMELDYLGNLWYYLICRLVEVKTSSELPSAFSVRETLHTECLEITTCFIIWVRGSFYRQNFIWLSICKFECNASSKDEPSSKGLSAKA